ncbi:MAG: lipid A biosynthesis acyltransferase [Flavobacteriia bacterium]|nr:lipid A biosynthesis acyltransferase [Flavobacteriia bacterium]
MGLIYVIGIKLAILLRLFAYRKKVIDNNLKNAFPKKDKLALRKIKHQFYSYFGQLLAESVKLFNCSKDTIRKRHKFVNDSQVNAFLKQDKDVIIVLGHYGNWEWALLASSLNFDAEMVGIYKPLSSKFWNKQVLKIRSQFGATLLSMKESVRYLLKKEKKPRVIGVLSDQTPSADELNHWINFLNQKTPVFLGTEKLAKKMDCPVFFAHIKPLSRAKYEIKFELITDTPNQCQEGEITRLHSQILEHNINRNPAYWLWSHRRWKHQQK